MESSLAPTATPPTWPSAATGRLPWSISNAWRSSNDGRYGIDLLKNLIRAIDPDYVLSEIPPNRFDAAMASFQATDSIADSAIAAGGEPDDLRWIHTDAYDAAYQHRLGVYNALFNNAKTSRCSMPHRFWMLWNRTDEITALPTVGRAVACNGSTG